MERRREENGLEALTIELLSRARASQDAEFKAKFFDIPYYLQLWTEPYGGLQGRRILDFVVERV